VVSGHFATIQVCSTLDALQRAMILGSIYVLGLIVPWFRPETRAKPLPE